MVAMSESAEHRMLDSSTAPTDSGIISELGKRSAVLWAELQEFLRRNYDFEPILDFLGKKYGWAYKYRRKGKTLCVLFPEKGGFTVLVTLGMKEVDKASGALTEFNQATQRIFRDSRQLHDGKWIYKSVRSKSDLRDVQKLIAIKKPPRASRD